MDLNQISRQAFLEQLSGWQIGLQGEAKRLKQLRRSSKNKLQLNTVEICLVAIEGELIKYRKSKEKKHSDSTALVEQYTALSKQFIAVMDKIAQAHDQDKYPQCFDNTNNQQENQQQNQQIKYSTGKGNSKNNADRSYMKPSADKSYLNSTHCARAKVPNRHKSTSFTQAIGPHRTVEKSKGTHKGRPQASLLQLQLQEEEDLADVRYQLKEIKSMMAQIENQIKFHSHEQLQRQMGRIAANNKKLGGQIRALKEDNQFLLGRVQGLKDDLAHEKKAQGEMIKQFQMGKEGRASVSELAKSNYHGQDVADWVKVRI